jgi:NADH:ubiquinone oxidoreductase subunit H
MELQPIEGWPAIFAMVAKNVGIFTVVIVVVAYATLAERRVSAFIQDRRNTGKVLLVP